MQFLGPWFLMGMLGLAGAAIPIILHFFFRSRYRTVAWAAMEFLLTSIEQTSRRLKFQELLLLILRCAVLLLLALALARPAFSLLSGGGGRDAVDAVLLIDNSASMGAREGAKSRFDLAKASALSALDHLPPHSTVQIFTCANTASEPLLREPANLDQARTIIQQLELTHQSTDLAPGLVASVRALKVSQASNKELYVFSDMQKQGFEQNGSQVTALLEEVSHLATIHLVRCGTRRLANVAIVGIVPQTMIPLPNQRVGFTVLVRNTGSTQVNQVSVSLAVDGNPDGAESQTISEFPPGKQQSVTLSARFEKPGLHVLTAFLSNDDLPGDNFLDQVVAVRDQVKILVVDGNLNLRDPSKSSSFYLVQALAPVSAADKAKYHLQIDVVPPREAGGALLDDKALCIFTNVPLGTEGIADPDTPPKEFLDALAEFVRKGKGLVIFGGDRVNPDEYNKLLGKRGLLPVPVSEVVSAPLDDPLYFDASSANLPAFSRFAEDDRYKALSVIPILKTVGLSKPQDLGKENETARVVFRYNNGKPAIVARKVGTGEVVMVGTSADPGLNPKSNNPTWNYLQALEKIGGLYVPFCHALVNHLLVEQTQNYNLAVGEVLRYYPEGELATRTFVLLPPLERKLGDIRFLGTGNRIALGPAKQPEGQRKEVAAAELLKAGVYFLSTRENDPADRLPFAVVPDPRESLDLDTLDDSEIDRQLGISPLHSTAKESEDLVFGAERSNREWTVWLLWLVLMLALGESLLAWFCGRAW